MGRAVLTKGFPSVTKQSKTPKIEAATIAIATTTTPPPPAANTETNVGAPRGKNLFVKVNTFDNKDNSNIGTRIVDMYHFGTSNWMRGHAWWAMHNGHIVEITVATAEEVEAHIAAQRQALADKFNTEKAHQAA